MTFAPLIVPLLAAVPFGPLLAWKRGDLYAVSQRLVFAFGAALVAIMVTLFFIDGMSVLAALGVGLAFWLILGSLTDIAMKSGFGDVSPRIMLRRFAGLPRSVFGTALAHVGLGLSTLGIVSASLAQHRTHHLDAARRYDRAARLFAALRRACSRSRGPNYTEDRGRFALFDAAGKPLGEIVFGQTLLCGKADAHDRGRDCDARFQPDLCFARQFQARWRHRRPGLVETVRHPYLDRRVGDGGRRRGLAVRPATEDRRAGAAANAR